MFAVRKYYLNLLKKDKRNLIEIIFYLFLFILSYLYGIIIGVRNFLYDRGIFPSLSCKGKVISVGGLTWAGSGKTTLSIWLYEKLSLRFRVAILRRGYGEDENSLLKDRGLNLYISPDRVRLAQELGGKFDIFILDDAFQYRKLKKDCNLVIMGPSDFKKINRLIPAYSFREPLTSLKRADILVLNYNDKIDNIRAQELDFKEKFPHLKIFSSFYKLKRFVTLENKLLASDYFKAKKAAAFAAIGYPEGFFDILSNLGIKVDYKIKYPDHYVLSRDEFKQIEEELNTKEISDLIITAKDKYHLPSSAKNTSLKIIVAEIEMIIDKEDEFLKAVEKLL